MGIFSQVKADIPNHSAQYLWNPFLYTCSFGPLWRFFFVLVSVVKTILFDPADRRGQCAYLKQRAVLVNYKCVMVLFCFTHYLFLLAL